MSNRFKVEDFIGDWELELRSGYTDPSEFFEELPERFDGFLGWYFDPSVEWLPPELMSEHLANLTDHTERFIEQCCRA